MRPAPFQGNSAELTQPRLADSGNLCRVPHLFSHFRWKVWSGSFAVLSFHPIKYLCLFMNRHSAKASSVAATLYRVYACRLAGSSNRFHTNTRATTAWIAPRPDRAAAPRSNCASKMRALYFQSAVWHGRSHTRRFVCFLRWPSPYSPPPKLLTSQQERR